MTDEQIKKRNDIIKELEEKRRKARYICDGYFITLDVYKNFLKEQGYILTGYDGGGNINWDSKCINFFKFNNNFQRHLNENMILVGNPEEWGTYVKDLWCDNIVNNPFVKFIKSNFTNFKIYKIVENEYAKDFSMGPRDEYLYRIKLEKDLSKEWIKYLVSICPEFATYQIEECEKKKKEAQDDFIRKRGNLVERLAKIIEEEKELPIIRDEKINRNNKIISIINEALEENKEIKI